jgi:arsenate reductase-like glutaredoxin family protein
MSLNIQLIGTKKCRDTQKAERFFNRTPIVRNGQLVTLGYRPEVWTECVKEN